MLALKGPAAVWPEREVLVERAELVEARLELPATRWPRLLKSVPAPRGAAAGAPSAADKDDSE